MITLPNHKILLEYTNKNPFLQSGWISEIFANPMFVTNKTKILIDDPFMNGSISIVNLGKNYYVFFAIPQSHVHPKVSITYQNIIIYYILPTNKCGFWASF